MSIKPPRVVIPGLNRGQGIQPGHFVGRLPNTGRGPAQLLTVAQMRAAGLLPGSDTTRRTSSAVSTVASSNVSLVSSLSTAIAVGSAVGWNLVDQTGAKISSGASWTWSTNVTNVDFVGLAAYTDLLLIGRGLTAGASVFRSIQCSVDNGSSFFTSSGNYVTVAATGVETSATQFDGTNAASASARSFWLQILGTNTTGSPKKASGSVGVERLFVGSLDPVTALRYSHVTTNITAGSLWLFAR